MTRTCGLLACGLFAMTVFSCAAQTPAARGSAAQRSTAQGASANAPAAQAAGAQAAPAESLTVSGHPGQVPTMQVGGRTFVEVEALARLAQATIAYRPGNVVLTLPGNVAPNVAPAQPARPKPGFSQGFLNAGIEDMTVIREWRSALVTAVQNGYPISDDWVSQYRRSADSRLALASAAATTDSDRQAYALLSAEFANMQKQSDRFLSMRKNLEFIATYSLDQDPLDQQILSCSRGLSGLVASGEFEDVPSCH